MLIKYFYTTIFILITSLSFSQVPKYSNDFMSIGIGARALGMSNSIVSLVDDVTAGYWNPAGLSLISQDRQIALMHNEYFAGIAKFDYGALAARIDAASVMSFSVIRIGIDDIPNTLYFIDSEGNFNYDKITSFSVADYGFLLSYGRNNAKIKGLRYGASAKVVHNQAGDFASSWGFGIDVGLQYDYRNWKFGICGRDITTTFNAWTYNFSDADKAQLALLGNDIPENSLEITLPRLIIGAGRKITIVKKISCLAALDVDVTFDGKRNVLIASNTASFDPHAGVEFSYNNIIFLRGGIGNIQYELNENNKSIRTCQFSAGLGINIKNSISIDYTLADMGNGSIALYSNVFSLKLSFNKPKHKSIIKF